jgi:hypothetical protein
MHNNSKNYSDNYNYHEILKYLLGIQTCNDVQLIRKEGELLLLIKQEPRQPVKYYMNKSGISARWFNEILQQLLVSKLIIQETCSEDGRRKLLS